MDAGVRSGLERAERSRPPARRCTACYGFADFRPGQEEILSAVLAGEDVMAVMPTGSGKSLFSNCPRCWRRATLVVSPLIALMRDQVAQCAPTASPPPRSIQPPTAAERPAIYDALENGRLRLLYVAPERLLRDDTLEMLQPVRIELFAIDEAHCVSQWGHDFRPEYFRLQEAAQALGRPKTLAVTATADAPTRTTSRSGCFSGRRKSSCVRSTGQTCSWRCGRRPTRPANSGSAETPPRRERHRLLRFASPYRRARDRSFRRGRRALPYHAGLERVRSHNQDAFLQEDGVVVCATVAFGMGIDKPDVRFVLHADMPSSIESLLR